MLDSVITQEITSFVDDQEILPYYKGIAIQFVR